jgi:hypothetical protein
MSEIEKLIESSRPVLAPRDEHRLQLQLRLRQRADPDGDTFLTRRPDVAVLALSVAAAFICWVLSLTPATVARAPQAYDFPGMDRVPRQIEHLGGQRAPGLVAYAQMLLPRTETTDLAALQRAIAETGRDRHLAERISEGK